jgi:hypothetical protein
MKKCPTCDKTFDDSMKFCQVDGTSLVDDEPAFDPYATMVGKPAPPVPPAEEPAATFDAQPEEQPAPIVEPSNVLEMPEADPLKTMYVSDAEMKEAFGQGSDEPVIEMPPAPEPPSFSSPEPPAPSFGDMSPPPSPFSTAGSKAEESAPAPTFEEAPTVMAPPPFETPSASAPPPAEWTPPPAPDASWQDQQIGSNTPFQPPATGSVNQTLAIVSLILGIVSLCCYISPVTGIAALVTGFMAMKKANADPTNYGGKGLAIAGMITGGIFFLIGVAYWIYIIVVIGFVGLSNFGR